MVATSCNCGTQLRKRLQLLQQLRQLKLKCCNCLRNLVTNTIFEHRFCCLEAFSGTWLRWMQTRGFFHAQQHMHAFSHVHAHAYTSCAHNYTTHIIHACTRTRVYALTHTQYGHTDLHHAHTQYEHMRTLQCTYTIPFAIFAQSQSRSLVASSTACRPAPPHDSWNGFHH